MNAPSCRSIPVLTCVVVIATLSALPSLAQTAAPVDGKAPPARGSLEDLDRALLPGSLTNTFHVIYAGDLARAYYLAAISNVKDVHRIIAGNPSTEKMVRIYRVFCREAGLKMPWLMPKSIIYPIGFLLEMFYTIFRVKNPPLLTRARVNMFYDSIGYETIKATKLLQFDNLVPLEEGIRKTVQWYRNKKLL